jgi:hypothetical protein
MAHQSRFYWRLIAVSVCLVWIVVFLVNLAFDSSLHQGLIPSPVWDGFVISTIIGAGFLIFFPLQFYIYAGFCCLWGLINIIDGGGLSGMLMYGLGLIFAYKKGFFRTVPVFKTVLAGLVLMAAPLFQILYGVAYFMGTVLEFLELCAVAGLTAALFRQELRAKMKEQGSPLFGRSFSVTEKELRLDRKHFTGRDLLILQTILAGGKYEAIAVEQQMGLSTLKKRVASLFSLLEVPDKAQFLKRYGKHEVVWDDPDREDVKQAGLIQLPG